MEKIVFEKDFFIATREGNDFLIYASDLYKLSEFDFMSLIKICIIESRNKTLGKRLLAIYKDCNKNKEEVKEKLKRIGLKDEGDTRPTKTSKYNTK